MIIDVGLYLSFPTLPTSPAGPNTNSVGVGEPDPQPASDAGVVAAAVIVTLLIVTIFVFIASVAGVIIYIRISPSKNANWCTIVRGVTREDTETVHQPAVYETIPEELVQTFTKNEAYVTQESAVMARNEAYTTLSPLTRASYI